MAHPRPFRFGLMAAKASSGADWVATAHKAEDLGYSALLMPDHYGDQLGTIPVVAALAGT